MGSIKLIWHGMTSIKNKLVEIQQEQAFERLEEFKDASQWSKMTSSEKELLAQLLVLQGKTLLEQGNSKVLESFECASKVSSYSSQILLQQGLAFAKCTDNIRCLKWAHEAFCQAIEKNPSLFQAWHSDALTLMHLGNLEEESSYFLEAQQKFEQAAKLFEQASPDFEVTAFFWKWGSCHCALGCYSGEPLDYHQAVEKFRQAEELGCVDAFFYNDYGNALASLADLVEKPAYFVEALKYFKRMTEIDSLEFEGWYNRGCCILRLTEISFNPELVEDGEVSFERASILNEEDSRVWYKWARLNSIHAKYKQDSSLLQQGLERFEIAYKLDPENGNLLCSWAEVELYLGAQQERLEMIQSARSRILKSIELQPNNPEGWYFYGSSLNELGRYFGDAKYYHQAIEQFQHGLSLSQNNPLLWYGLALSHYALGEITDEQLMYEKAVRFCAKVIENGGGGLSQFWNDWGVAYMKLAEMTLQPHFLEQAIEKFEKALNQPTLEINADEVDLEWVYNYGCAFDLMGEFTEEACHFEKAVNILSQVVQLEPEYNQARYNLALALANLAEALYDVEFYEKSIEQFQILLAQDPEDEIIQMDFGVTLVHKALLVHDDHHPERSQALFRQAEMHLLQSASLGNSQAYYQLAGLYSLTDRFQYAMHYIERAQFFGALPSIDDLMHDDWLEGLRHTPGFRQFINSLSSRSQEENK